MSELQNELRRKGQIEIGKQLMLYGGEWRLLKVGDTYIGHTEGEEPEILTVRRVEVQRRRTNQIEGKVFPKERKKKLYDLNEVVKVTFIDNPNLNKENKTNERRTELPARVDVPTGGSVGHDGAGVEANGLPQPRPNRPQPPRNRPVPRAPRRGGKRDYTKPDVPGGDDRADDGDSDRS